MFAPRCVPRPIAREIGVWPLTAWPLTAWSLTVWPLTRGFGLAVIAIALAGLAGAEAQSRKAGRDAPPDPGKPPFFVDWGASGPPPGLTAKPTRAKSDSLPVYPTDSARKGEAGTTALTLCVTTEGRLVDIKLARSSGFSRLDDATIEWARNARFNPALINGDPVNVCGYFVEYAWRLNG